VKDGLGIGVRSPEDRYLSAWGNIVSWHKIVLVFPVLYIELVAYLVAL
jgi:hypothetical protein